jgi:hypothetical protein
MGAVAIIKAANSPIEDYTTSRTGFRTDKGLGSAAQKNEKFCLRHCGKLVFLCSRESGVNL